MEILVALIFCLLVVVFRAGLYLLLLCGRSHSNKTCILERIVMHILEVGRLTTIIYALVLIPSYPMWFLHSWYCDPLSLLLLFVRIPKKLLQLIHLEWSNQSILSKSKGSEERVKWMMAVVDSIIWKLLHIVIMSGLIESLDNFPLETDGGMKSFILWR